MSAWRSARPIRAHKESQDFVATPPARPARPARLTSSATVRARSPLLSGDRSLSRESAAVQTALAPGHIQISDRWTGSSLVQLLAEPFAQVHLGTFKTFDFRPSPGTVVLLLTEADYVGSPGQAFKRKVAKFYAQRGACQAVVICQRSELTSLEFLAVQEFVVIHLGLALIPISDQKELPQFLHQLSGVQRKANPFLLGRQPSPAFSVKATPGLSVTVHKELLTTLATIPGLGQKRARALLTHFRTLLAICQASPRDLAQVVGQSQASSVYNFVHAKRAPSKSTR